MPPRNSGDGNDVPHPTQEGLDEILDRAHAQEDDEDDETDDDP